MTSEKEIQRVHSAVIETLYSSSSMCLFAFGVAIGQWFGKGTSSAELEKEFVKLERFWPDIAREARTALTSTIRQPTGG